MLFLFLNIEESSFSLSLWLVNRKASIVSSPWGSTRIAYATTVIRKEHIKRFDTLSEFQALHSNEEGW